MGTPGLVRMGARGGWPSMQPCGHDSDRRGAAFTRQGPGGHRGRQGRAAGLQDDAARWPRIPDIPMASGQATMDAGLPSGPWATRCRVGPICWVVAAASRTPVRRFSSPASDGERERERERETPDDGHRLRYPGRAAVAIVCSMATHGTMLRHLCSPICSRCPNYPADRRRTGSIVSTAPSSYSAAMHMSRLLPAAGMRLSKRDGNGCCFQCGRDDHGRPHLSCAYGCLGWARAQGPRRPAPGAT